MLIIDSTRYLARVFFLFIVLKAHSTVKIFNFFSRRLTDVHDHQIWLHAWLIYNRIGEATINPKNRLRIYSENFQKVLKISEKIFKISFFFKKKSQYFNEKYLKIPNKFTPPEDIAEVFNNHFTRLSIGQTLAREIPTVDIDPLYYVKPSDKVFSFERINVQEVVNLLKGIDGGKATGLNNIPCKLFKIAADVVAPS